MYNRSIVLLERGALSLIIVAFLLPLALYLLALSWVNRQSTPIVISGTWDFLGLLFAASGFLLFGGPAVLSSLNERWRRLWLFGDPRELPDWLANFRDSWLLLAVGYFVVVVVGSGWILAHRRRLTCIYNVEPSAVEASLEETYRHFGLSPIRSGDLYVFGFANRLDSSAVLEPKPGETSALLEVESFPPLKHVSLRWEPHDSPLRGAVETELAQRLGRLAAPYHESAAWLNLAGTTLLIGSLLIVTLLVARVVFQR